MRVPGFNGKWARRSAIAAVMLSLGAGLCWWNQDDLRIWWYVRPPATHVPPFDSSRAATLTPERRAELERELFIELPMWNTQSRRYVEPNGRLEREQRWQQMADEGYELAHLVLLVLQPSKVAVHDPRAAFTRAEELAQQGDAGAMCLMVRLIHQLPYDAVKDSRYYENRKKYWLQRGADSGHPQCLVDLGRRLKAGTEGQPHDPVRGNEMLFRAMALGYESGSGAFWREYERRGLHNFLNRRRVYCWQYQSAKYTQYPADQLLSYYARQQVSESQKEFLRSELKTLQKWHPNIEECIQLSQGE